MLEALTSGYTRKDIRNVRRDLPLETNIGKLFSLFAWGLQFVHEEADKILEWDNLDNAQGVVLDRYGANFGVARNGASDAFYRLLIKVKLIAMLSGGDIDTVINAAAALLDVPVEDINLKEHFPAKISIHVNEALLTTDVIEYAELIMQLMKRIVAAGVGFDLYINTYRYFDNQVWLSTAGFIVTDVKAFPTSRPRNFNTGSFYMGTAAFIYAEVTAPTINVSTGG